MVDLRYLPFLIIAPILVLALIGGAIYVTCWRTTLVVPPTGWKPYTLRERKSVKEWFHGLRNPSLKSPSGVYDEENFQMLDRPARMGTGGAGGRGHEPEDWHSLRTSTAASMSSLGTGRYEPQRHARNTSYASYHSAYSADIAADDEISDEEDQNRLTASASHQQTVDLGPIIADVRLAIDSATTLLQQFKTLSEFDANSAKSPSPASSPPPTPGSPGSLLTEEDYGLITQLQSLTDFHDHVLEYAWKHSGPTPPPLDTSHLQQLKDLTAKGMTVAMQAEARRTQIIRSKEVLRTQWMSRYGDLKRTEEFARASLSQILQRRQQKRVGSGGANVDDSDEMEHEVRMLGLRAMRERVALGRKLELKIQEEGSEDEWGLEGSDSEVGGQPVIPSPPPPLFAEPRRAATDVPARKEVVSFSRRRATDEGFKQAYVPRPPRIVEPDDDEDERLLGQGR